ncbi:MAG: response regulator transcription factor [Candidatus Gastranaerophilales bacterium]|nr:response regulator transcription factor [Candidatus Gastranaerophilales bacterium]
MNENKKIQVLLVEDHTMTRMGLQLVIEKSADIQIVGEAENGRQAVDLAKKLIPDVILMDIGLPIIDGIEATRQIKDNSIDSKILIFTSRESEEDVFAAFSAGADSYIMKGANPEQIITAIKSVNDGVAWLDPLIAKMVLKNINKRPVHTSSSDGFSKNSFSSPFASTLTERELEVLSLIVEGLSNPQIAERLIISRATAKAHVHSILQKLCVSDRTQAAVMAMREGIV